MPNIITCWQHRDGRAVRWGAMTAHSRDEVVRIVASRMPQCYDRYDVRDRQERELCVDVIRSTDGRVGWWYESTYTTDGELEKIRKRADDPSLRAGDIVFCRSEYAIVEGVHYYGPGEHPQSCIRSDWGARAVVTNRGTRWLPLKPAGGE